MSENKITPLLQKLVDCIEHEYGGDTVVLHVSEQCSIADYAVITSSRNPIHAKVLMNTLIAFLTENNITALNHRRHFDENSGWIVVDCDDIIIHIMSEEKREFYQLERLWFESEYVYGKERLSTIDD